MRTGNRRRDRQRRHADGFTYVGMIVLVTIIGLVGAATLKADALLQRAVAEQELLETGAAFVAALDSYAAATPEGQPTQPSTLQDLLADRRLPIVKRHLRRIPVDPISGKPAWGLVYGRDQSGLIGVYSLSQARPFKRTDFDGRFPDFDNKQHLSDWKFMVSGQERSGHP